MIKNRLNSLIDRLNIFSPIETEFEASGHDLDDRAPTPEDYDRLGRAIEELASYGAHSSFSPDLIAVEQYVRSEWDYLLGS